jgi:hypothetical protein
LQQEYSEVLSREESLRAEITDQTHIDARFRSSAEGIRAQLATLASITLPGVVHVPKLSEEPFEESIRALAATEQAGAECVVEIMSGSHNGSERAVKVLRLGFAAAWWEALDASAAGIVRVHNGALILEDADTALQATIHQAVLMVDGRVPASAVILPFTPILVSEAAP